MWMNEENGDLHMDMQKWKWWYRKLSSWHHLMYLFVLIHSLRKKHYRILALYQVDIAHTVIIGNPESVGGEAGTRARVWKKKELSHAKWVIISQRASLVAQMVKNLLTRQETWVRSLSLEDPIEKGKTTHSSILACRIPWTEESGRLQSMGSQRVRHNWATNTFFFSISKRH